MSGATIVEGDALAALRAMPGGSVDLVVSSPPYNVRKAYERGRGATGHDGYVAAMRDVVGELARVMADDGSICWQVGNTMLGPGLPMPLDYVFAPLFQEAGLTWRGRAVWAFGAGLHEARRFSGRHETLSWWTRGGRTPVKGGPCTVDGARYDPADDFPGTPVWRVPAVGANHPEKTAHPCCMPSEIVRRCILAHSREGELVLDPFCGTGIVACCAVLHGRRATGIERDPGHAAQARRRVGDAEAGRLALRPFTGGRAAPGRAGGHGRGPDGDPLARTGVESERTRWG